MPLFIYFNTQTMHIKSKTHNSIAMFFLKPYTLAGFEPGSAVSEADAMSTAPRRQGLFSISWASLKVDERGPVARGPFLKNEALL
jgi:hypothetical protein